MALLLLNHFIVCVSYCHRSKSMFEITCVMFMRLTDFVLLSLSLCIVWLSVWKWYLPYDNNKVPNCCVIFLTLKQINLLKRSFFHIEQTMPLKEKQLNGNCYLCFMFWLRLRVCMLFLYSFSTLPMTSLRISLWLFIATSCCCCCFFISV